jgi:hypothetical protein
MAKPRMDLSAFVGKLLEEQDGDVLLTGRSVRHLQPRADHKTRRKAASFSVRNIRWTMRSLLFQPLRSMP